MKAKGLLIGLVIGLLIMVFIPRSSLAAMRKMETAELTRGSEKVVIGTVKKIVSLYEQGIFTDVTLTVEQSIKGSAIPEITVRIPGGEINGVSLKVSDIPTFNQDERVILFITKSKVGSYNIVFGLSQGKFSIINNIVKENKLPLATFIQNIKANNIEPKPVINLIK